MCSISNGGGDLQSSTADVASCNYTARSFGLRNGMWLREAVRLCPGLVTLPYEFEVYSAISKQFYEVIRGVSSQIQAVSCDECYVKLSGLVEDKFRFMQELKGKIREQTGLSCTVGLGDTLVQARVATKLGKPNGALYLDKY